MGPNNLKRGDIVNFEDYDRIVDASIEAITAKAILVKWAYDATRTSDRWIPKSVITGVKKKGRGYILTVSEWFWKAN